MPRLLEMMATEEYEIKKEAAYAVCNACVGGGPAVMSGIVQLGSIPRLCELLECPDALLIFSILEALEAGLRMGAETSLGGPNQFAVLVEQAGGCEKIEALQMHENADVFQKASHVIDTFFGDEGAEDAAIAPVAQADGYCFGMPP